VVPASANDDGKSKARPASDKEAARSAPPPPVPASAGPDGAPAAQAWSQAEIIEALQSCLKTLGPVVAEIDPKAPLRAGDCGVAAPIALAAVGAHPRVEVRPPATLNCAVAGRLSRWMEDVVQPAAREFFGAPVVKMLNISGYQCRNRNGASGPAGKTSEHAFANAIDVGAFELANGRRVDVAADWGPTERDLLEARRQESMAAGADQETAVAPATRAAPRTAAAASPPGTGRERAHAAAAASEQQEQPQRGKKEAAAKTARADRGDPADRSGSAATGSADGERAAVQATTAPRELTPAARFLRRLHAGACGPFGTVLGPEANEAHRDHLHLDLAPRKRTAFCE
jgi:hypothetical protein